MDIYERQAAAWLAKRSASRRVARKNRRLAWNRTDAELHWPKWEPIEQAIARGLSSSRIMADLTVPYEAVSAVRNHMNRVVA